MCLSRFHYLGWYSREKSQNFIQHDSLPSYCLNCSKLGHSFDMCFVKYPHLRPVKGGGQTYGVSENAGMQHHNHQTGKNNSDRLNNFNEWPQWSDVQFDERTGWPIWSPSPQAKSIDSDTK